MSTGPKEALFSYLRVIVPAACLFAVGICLFSIKTPDHATTDEKFRELGLAFTGFLCVVAGALLLTAPLGRALSSVLESIFWPLDAEGTPPPLYKLPEWYIQQKRYPDAVAEYQKIIRHHPHDEAAWKGLLYVFHVCLGDKKEVERVLKRAGRKLGKEQNAALKKYHADLSVC